jgi:hypothetical protein
MDDPNSWVQNLLKRINAASIPKVVKLSDVKVEDKQTYSSLVHSLLQKDDLIRVLMAFDYSLMNEYAKEIASYNREELRRKLTAYALTLLPFPYTTNDRPTRAQEVLNWLDANPIYKTTNLANLAQSMCCFFMLETHTYGGFDISKTLEENTNDMLNYDGLEDPFQ